MKPYSPPRPQRWDTRVVESIVAELADDDVLACSALFSIARIVYSTDVPTLAIRSFRGQPPELWINLEFLEAHAEEEKDIRFLLMHEFLHVVHGHLSIYPTLGPLENIAMDAVVNHTLARRFGGDFTDFCHRYYDLKSPAHPYWLLCPESDPESAPDLLRRTATPKPRAPRKPGRSAIHPDSLQEMREQLAGNNASLEDIRDFLREHALEIKILPADVLGGHDPNERRDRRFDPWIAEAAKAAAKIMNSDRQGWATNPKTSRELETQARNSSWSETARPLIERFLVRGVARPRHQTSPVESRLPVATPRDRRACLRSLHSRILPDYSWLTEQPSPIPDGKVCLYIDVSGSMTPELELAAGLLLGLGDLVHPPAWAWSDIVEPARFEDRRLVTRSSGGTDIDPALAHFLRHPLPRAVVLTDGFFQAPSEKITKKLRRAGKHWGAILTPNGDESVFKQLHIPYIRLNPIPL